MIRIAKTAPNRIEMEFEGDSIDEDTMQNAIEELIALTKDMEHGQLLYRLQRFPWPSLAAIGVKFGHLPDLFKMLGRFDRCAVLSDESWLRTASDIEGALIPGLEIKGFRMDEAEAADAWLTRTD
ncbi:STAS/SEC14 domain-containing protein [Nisaea sp.]|uniref:STAS/SEC14 domain-containing protein n=1 Tax=Nisaea sp. TaxID=2024842 RepID=UPI003B5172A8